MNLKDLLTERGIKTAHIVDDAYDQTPTYAMSAEDAQQVLEVIDDSTLNNICAILGLQSQDEEGVRSSLQTIEGFNTLFTGRDQIPGTAADLLFDQFEKDKASKQAQLKPLVDLLQANGIDCHFFGSNYNPANTDEPQLFFVDLKLKEGAGVVPRHEDALQVYRTLKLVHKGCKPFVFLMSSLPLVLGAKRELFRKEADLFQSEFEDIQKSVFSNTEEFTRILLTYTNSMPQLAALRESMVHVESAVREATESVMRELRSLDLADYFVLYHNTTSVEKVNLGSYIVEMLLEFLQHEVEGQSRVWALAKALDGLKLEELPRSRFGISPAAAQLYSANMLHSPAMLLAEDAAQQGPTHGHFFTGDIFIDAQSLNLPAPNKALAVITPACDLVRPEQLSGRSVLLCEGTVREMTLGSSLIATDGLPLVVMQHPRDPERHITIEWNKKKLEVWDDTDRAKFSTPECSLVRVGRLRSIYALQLQHAVTSDLSRVGTQKPPSSLVPNGFKCFVSDGKVWNELYADPKLDSAALSDSDIRGKKHTLYVFSDQALHNALSKLTAWISEHPDVEKKASFEKVLEDDARKSIRGFRQRVPEKAPKGKALDVTAYPFDGTWAGDEGKFVALVRGANCASPYSQIAEGHNVRPEQLARLVFRLERSPEKNLNNDM